MVWFWGDRVLCGDLSGDQGAPGLSPTLGHTISWVDEV